jgi:HTH-type transcriptional regulator/antitoxin MqsA
MPTPNDTCHLCSEGHLHALVDKNPVEYQGQSTLLDCHYSVCDFCGSEQADASQTRANKRNMIAFKKTVDGLLTGQEIKALRKRLGINQNQAALLFGGGPVAFSKYENDDVMQSESMDKLLRLADAVPAAFECLAQWVNTPPVSQTKPLLPRLQPTEGKTGGGFY